MSEHGMSERGGDEERRLAGLLKRAVPAPPRELSAEEIMVTTHDRSRKTWMLPALSAAAILVIGVTIGVIATHHSGPAKANFSPAASQSSASPGATPAAVASPTASVPVAAPSPAPGTATPEAIASPTASPTASAPLASPSPAPGTATPGPTAVPTPSAVASPPRGDVVVPDVLGMAQAQATTALQQAGLDVVIIAEADSNSLHMPTGMVWGQNLVPGSVVAKGTTVTLDVQPAA